mgnify:CR=1 FL=1
MWGNQGLPRITVYRVAFRQPGDSALAGLAYQDWHTRIGIPGLAYQNWHTRIGIPELAYQDWHTRIGIPTIRFVPQKTNNKIRATENQHCNACHREPTLRFVPQKANNTRATNSLLDPIGALLLPIGPCWPLIDPY